MAPPASSNLEHRQVRADHSASAKYELPTRFGDKRPTAGRPNAHWLPRERTEDRAGQGPEAMNGARVDHQSTALDPRWQTLWRQFKIWGGHQGAAPHHPCAADGFSPTRGWPRPCSIPSEAPAPASRRGGGLGRTVRTRWPTARSPSRASRRGQNGRRTGGNAGGPRSNEQDRPGQRTARVSATPTTPASTTPANATPRTTASGTTPVPAARAGGPTQPNPRWNTAPYAKRLPVPVARIDLRKPAHVEPRRGS